MFVQWCPEGLSHFPSNDGNLYFFCSSATFALFHPLLRHSCTVLFQFFTPSILHSSIPSVLQFSNSPFLRPSTPLVFRSSIFFSLPLLRSNSLSLLHSNSLPFLLFFSFPLLHFFSHPLLFSFSLPLLHYTLHNSVKCFIHVLFCWCLVLLKFLYDYSMLGLIVDFLGRQSCQICEAERCCLYSGALRDYPIFLPMMGIYILYFVVQPLFHSSTLYSTTLVRYFSNPSLLQFSIPPFLQSFCFLILHSFGLQLL